MGQQRFSRGEWVLAIFVCVAGTFVGNFVGTLFWSAGGLSLPWLFGAIGGLLAGVIWSRFMIPRRGRGRVYAVGVGTLMGIVVGMLATVILHLSAIVQSWPMSAIQIFPIGLVAFGIPAGAVTGLVCGLLLCLLPGRKQTEGQSARPDSAVGEVGRS